MIRCNRCLTPESYPGTTFGHEGICNHCVEYERLYSDWEETKEARLEKFGKMIDSAKKKSRQYDVLVPLSGGKDSTYVLYLATKKYGCKTLCYNFDNGFVSEVARENIKSAVDASGADLITYKPNSRLLMRLYRHFLKNTGLFCPVCMRGIVGGQFLMTEQFNIPLVLKGSSRRTEESLGPEVFQDGDLTFFKNVLKAFPFDEDIRSLFADRSFKDKLFRALFLLSNGRISLGALDIQLPYYFDWDYNEIFQTISSEMGWKALADRDEHVDCQADPAMHHFRRMRCRDLTPSTLRYSAEIRSGQRDRAEALQLVEEEMRTTIDNEHYGYFLNMLDISGEELEAYMEDDLRHMEYQKPGIIKSMFSKAKGILTK